VLGEVPHSDRSLPMRTQGSSNEMLKLLRELPAGQLMILGAPGAGKTFAVISCTLDLLATRKSDDVVPVLLTASSWNPRKERVDGWLSRRLREEYPWLANAEIYGDDAASRLVAARRILLVLDGLDEVSAQSYSDAFKALNIYAMSNYPFLVTCRLDEYDKGVHNYGAVLTRAAVVELEPLRPSQMADYLCAGPTADGGRWLPVLHHLDAKPDGPLAQALSTPLMVDLARTAYQPQHSDPLELLASEKLATRNDVEQHLVANYSATRYTVHHDRLAYLVGTPPRADPGSRYRYDDASRWLTFLARHVRRPEVGGIAWWRMRSAMPRWPFQCLLGAIFGTAAGVVMGTAAGVVYGDPFRSVAGVGVGLGVSFGTALMAGPLTPTPARLGFRLPLRRLVTRLPQIFVAGLLSGLAFGAVFAAAVGPGRGLAIGMTAGLVAGVAGATGVSMGMALKVPLDPHDDVSQASLFRSDRLATLLLAVITGLFSGLVAGLAGVLTARPDKQISVSFIAGLGVAIGAALVTVARSAWGQWFIARLWLTATGKVPWAFVKFLEDAHRRGMLRRVGSEYEFRHRSVQDYFTGKQTQHDQETRRTSTMRPVPNS
jgi:hypothetical protein